MAMRALQRLIGGGLMVLIVAACQNAPSRRFVPVTNQLGAMDAMKARAFSKARSEADAQFRGFDRDHNQRLTNAEFVEGLLQAHRREVDEALDAHELAQIRRDAAQEFQGLDANRDRALTAAEFAKRND